VTKSKDFFDCSVVVISGGKPRIDLTIQTLNCINNQELQPREKIFVNHGHSEEIMKKISNSQEILKNWKVITFPINTYDPLNLDSLFKFTGPASLSAASSQYVFYISDDDIVDLNFFRRMSILISDRPEVIVASGLPVGIDRNGSKIYPPKGSWETRDKYEHGINVFRNIFKPDELYHPNPGHSYIIKRSFLEETRSTIFISGFPDISPLFQIVPKGLFAFDKEALMIRQNHTEQIHNEWDIYNTQFNLYIPWFKKMFKINCDIMKDIKYVNKKDLKLIKNYYRRQITRASFFSIKNRVPDFEPNRQIFRTPISLKLKYLVYILLTPVYSIRIIFKPGRLKIFIDRTIR